MTSLYYIKYGVKSMEKKLNRTLKWLDKTEGRDKFCKSIQYACRFLKYRYQQKGQKQMAKKVDALFGSMKDARKLFRLFKSFKQLSKLLDVLGKSHQNMNDLLFSVITRIGFLLYWMFDNLAILSKIKVITMDTKALAKKGATFWFIALFATFIMTVKNIFINYRKILALKNSTVKIYDSSQMSDRYQKRKSLQKNISKDLLLLVKTVGDMLPAGQGCQFYSKFLGFSVNQGFCGIGGLVSALITSYQLYD